MDWILYSTGELKTLYTTRLQSLVHTRTHCSSALANIYTHFTSNLGFSILPEDTSEEPGIEEPNLSVSRWHRSTRTTRTSAPDSCPTHKASPVSGGSTAGQVLYYSQAVQTKARPPGVPPPQAWLQGVPPVTLSQAGLSCPFIIGGFCELLLNSPSTSLPWETLPGANCLWQHSSRDRTDTQSPPAWWGGKSWRG